MLLALFSLGGYRSLGGPFVPKQVQRDLPHFPDTGVSVTIFSIGRYRCIIGPFIPRYLQVSPKVHACISVALSNKIQQAFPSKLS